MKNHWTYYFVLVSYLALFALALWWAIQFAVPDQGLPTTLRIIAFAGPLLVPLWGVLYARPRSYAWAGFLSLGYFTLGVVESYSQPTVLIPALSVTGISFCLFVATIIAIRHRPTPS